MTVVSTILITGGDGQLGTALRETAPDAVRLLTPGRAELDLLRPNSVDAVVRTARPEIVINTAAYTDVERAESEASQAHAVNAEGATAVAAAAARAGARMIHISTDFVFDGRMSRPYRPTDPTAPLSVYGASKLAGEQGVTACSGGRALIVRTAWLYGMGGTNFVTTMLRRMRSGAVRVVADQVGSPTWSRSLAAAIWSAVERPALCGLHHWADAGVASWYDFAMAIQEEALALGLLEQPVSIDPIRTEDYPTEARRPSYSVLDAHETRAALARPPIHWRTNLRRMLAEAADG
jgi:dTDP-4-dehydrorhamnose reductase